MARTTSTARFFAAALLGAAVAQAISAPVEIDVTAKVKDYEGTPKIGKLTVSSGFEGSDRGLLARFEFDTRFAFLDKRYDFDYVNIVTDLSAGFGDLFPKGKPAIDPQSGDVSGASEDDYPYYFHFENEWRTNKFGTDPSGDPRPVREDGKYSRFIDFPNHPTEGNFLDFTGTLVVRDNDSVKFHDAEAFGLLAAFGWKYEHTASDNHSTVSGSVAVNDALRTLVTNALKNEHRDVMKDWTAQTTFELVPAPGSTALLALGGVLAARRRRAA